MSKKLQEEQIKNLKEHTRKLEIENELVNKKNIMLE